MIEVHGLVKRFEPGVTAVDDVSFEVRPGEVFGVLGPNGAGKTTLLRVIATLLQADAGVVRVAGFDAADRPAQVRSRIGYLSATTALYPRLTVREVLGYFARLHGVSRPRRRVSVLMERFGLGPLADVRCERLSTGQRQNVNIARTVVHDPPVLVFDEPTSGLDVLVAQAFLEFVEEARRRGTCVLYSTHIMSEAERLCDRLGVLHQGRLYACGTLPELRARTGEHYLEQVFLHLVGHPR